MSKAVFAPPLFNNVVPNILNIPSLVYSQCDNTRSTHVFFAIGSFHFKYPQENIISDQFIIKEMK